MTLREKICSVCGLLHQNEVGKICPNEFAEYKRKEREENEEEQC